jgi:NAD(P)-dependent dehydrogenase (short-subunit alcohol dehydrogenase family)
VKPLESPAPEPSSRARTALVTGAGSGIGRAIALGLAADGFTTILSGRRSGPLAEVAAAAAAAGGRAEVLTADLADRSSTDRLADAVAVNFAPLSVLVHNAGLGGPSPLDDPYVAEFDLRVETNLVAPLRLTRALLPSLAKDGSGRIVAISSVLARFGVPDYHAYAAAKAGLVGFCRALAKDLARDRITVNAVLPGWTRTEMAEASWARLGSRAGGDARAGEAAAMKDVPLGRPADPEEIASFVRWICSPAAAAFTGQAVAIDGGVTA